MNTLRVATQDELHKLLPHMKTYLPDSMMMHGSLDMYNNYKIFDEFDTKFYVPNNKNQLQSLVVMYPWHHAVDNQDSQAFHIFWDVNTENDEDVMSCLRSLPNINWRKKYLVISTFSISEKLQNLSEILSGDKVEVNYRLVANLCINERDMPDFKLPSGFRLGTLQPEHVEYVNSKYGKPGSNSDEFISAEFRHLPTAAVYKISENDHDDKSELPVSFSTIRHSGEIGRSFTLPEYRGLGMANVTGQDLVKKLNKKGSLPYVRATITNPDAMRIFGKLGFVEKYKTAHTEFKPIGLPVKPKL